MTLSDPAVYQYVGRRGNALQVRFPRGRIRSAFSETMARGPVRSVQLAQQTFSGELTLELNPTAGKESVSYDPLFHELRISIPGPGPGGPPRPAVSYSPSVPFFSQMVPALPARKRRPIQKIMVDPGHGGRDVGALGLSGLLEKNVNLKLALILAQRLRSKGYDVALTRTTDVFVPLSERSQMANRWGADLFVSVHCNSSLYRKARGFEVYFLSETATDAEADSVARTENSALVLEHTGKIEPALKRLLLSMAQNQYLNESSRLCAYLAKKVDGDLKNEKTSVKQANFYLLREAGMPAVLVEFEYISNPVSEARLRSRRFCQKLVSAVCGGIANYESVLKEHRGKGAT